MEDDVELEDSQAERVKKLLAGNLWPMLTTEPGVVRLERLVSGLTGPLDSLIESLVLYDEVVLPTQDMIIIPALVRTLGLSNVRHLLDSGALKFVRIRRLFGYTPGTGASVLEIRDPDGRPTRDSQPLDELLYWIATECVGETEPMLFLDSLVHVTSEIDAQEFTTVIREESETDAKTSALVRELYGIPDVDPKRLPIAKDTVAFYSGPDLEGENAAVQGYLRLVQTNVEASLSTRFGCDDVYSATRLDALLDEKFARAGHDEASSKIMLLAEIPDYAGLVRTHAVSLGDILKLRNSNDGEAFRRWFHEAVESGEDISKAYVDLITRLGPMDGVSGKLTRVALWTAASSAAGTAAGPAGTALGAAVGLAGGLFDSFVMNKVRLGGSAKVFTEKLSKLAK